jgi:Icc protein
MSRTWSLLISAAAMLGPGCVHFSPYQIELTEDERRQTEKNLAKLEARDRAPASLERPLTFALLGDSHDGYRNWKDIVAAINSRPEIELVLHAGDLTDFGSQQEYEWAYEVFSAEHAPFIAAPGNHDGLSNGRELYSQMFGPTNFTFDYAGVHFVVFNTNPVEWKLASPDVTWLEDQVGKGGARTFVLTHQPPFSEPRWSTASIDRLLAALQTAPVALYMYGHIHPGFAAQKKGPTTFLKTEAALDGSWVLVHYDGAEQTFEACRFDTCTPGPLPDEAPGVDDPSKKRAP